MLKILQLLAFLSIARIAPRLPSERTKRIAPRPTVITTITRLSFIPYEISPIINLNAFASIVMITTIYTQSQRARGICSFLISLRPKARPAISPQTPTTMAISYHANAVASGYVVLIGFWNAIM